jgi:hypothetical protein
VDPPVQLLKNRETGYKSKCQPLALLMSADIKSHLHMHNQCDGCGCRKSLLLLHLTA